MVCWQSFSEGYLQHIQSRKTQYSMNEQKSVNKPYIINYYNPTGYFLETAVDAKRVIGRIINALMLYPDSGISMDEEIALGDMIWSYNKAEL